MATEWNQAKLQELIDDQVEESHSLEYKAAGALNVAKKDEIAKDISAMANAAGGTIIYGIAGFNDEPKKHLPEKLSPTLRNEFSKERLEQLINSNIKPRIEGVVIHPVSLNSGSEHVAYVVEIPQSTTAHQTSDFRYYRRYNFEVLPMLDHEIRDVMGRRQNPKISLEFYGTAKVETYSNPYLPTGSFNKPRTEDFCDLKIYALNKGDVYANFVCCFLLVPRAVLTDESAKDKHVINQNGAEYCHFTFENTTRDYVGSSSGHPQYGPSRHEPILPSLSGYLNTIRLCPLEKITELKKLSIRWIAHADNAPPANGKISLQEISFKDMRGVDNKEEE